MIKVVLLICVFICLVVVELHKLSSHFANDLIAILQKAHGGKFPDGERSPQYISTQHFSRDELRLPIDPATLQQMDSCDIVHKYDVSCRIVSSKTTFKRSTIYLALSIYFDGERNDGERIHVEVQNTLISAVVILENHVWQLIKIHLIAQ